LKGKPAQRTCFRLPEMALNVEQVRAIAERVAQTHGLEIVDVEFRGSAGKARMLRIFLDKPGGVTHDDCELVSREVSTILDVEDTVPGGSYTLEVSSPGLDRKLTKAADFQRFVGSRVKVMTKEPVGGNRHFEGRLREFAADLLVLSLESGKKPKPGHRHEPAPEVEIALANVERANLVPEI
jgi:ribosome maturation factor RimP